MRARSASACAVFRRPAQEGQLSPFRLAQDKMAARNPHIRLPPQHGDTGKT